MLTQEYIFSIPYTPAAMTSQESISVLCEAGRGATAHALGVVPMGLLSPLAPTMGTLLFVTRAGEDLRQAAVYFTQVHYGCGPFVDSYEHIGTIAQLYPQLPFEVVGGVVQLGDETLSVLCGQGSRSTLVFAIKREDGDLDVFMQMFPQVPSNLYSHFVAQGDDPMQWWRCRSCFYHGPVHADPTTRG